MSWKENLAAKWWKVKIADQALQVEKDTRRQLVTERSIENAYRLTQGHQPLDLPDELGENMSVSVGDSTNYYNSKKSMLEGVGGLLVGGVSAAALTYALLQSQPQPTSVGAPVNQEVGYKFSLGFPDKEKQ